MICLVSKRFHYIICMSKPKNGSFFCPKPNSSWHKSTSQLSLWESLMTILKWPFRSHSNLHLISLHNMLSLKRVIVWGKQNISLTLRILKLVKRKVISNTKSQIKMTAENSSSFNLVSVVIKIYTLIYCKTFLSSNLHLIFVQNMLSLTRITVWGKQNISLTLRILKSPPTPPTQEKKIQMQIQMSLRSLRDSWE